MYFFLLKTDLLNAYIDSPKASNGFIKILLIISANISVMAIEYLGSNNIASLCLMHRSREINIKIQ